MNILELFKGKKIMVMTDMGVEVKMTIKQVREEHCSEDLEPATPLNDWWPKTRDWTEYVVEFTTGKTKKFD